MNAFFHRQITQDALGHKVNPAALAAIIAANLKQDSLSGQVGHPEFHFDDNAFIATHKYMEQQTSLAMASIQAKDFLSAQKAYGRLSHCSQDFYAHSNYVALWVNLHPEFTAAEIDPLDPEILTLPSLHSGRIYYPWEVLTYLPFIGRVFRLLLPRDSHAWMNLDSPTSGLLFDYARVAAIKRTGIEFNLISSLFLEQGGAGILSLFTGLSESMNEIHQF
jgi:hypothetical protein